MLITMIVKTTCHCLIFSAIKLLINDTYITVDYLPWTNIIIVLTINVFIYCFSFYTRHQFTTSKMQLSKAHTCTCYNDQISSTLNGYLLLVMTRLCFKSRTDYAVKLRHVGSETISRIFARDRCIRFDLNNKNYTLYITF